MSQQSKSTRFYQLIILATLLNVQGTLDAGPFKNTSLYFAGAVKHFDTADENRDGNMALIGFSKDLQWNDWLFETGAASFIDSYHVDSYMLFSNVSHKNYTYAWFRPTIGLTCAYKGEELRDLSRDWICAPIPKVRIGKDKGLFSSLAFIPKFGDVTNGFVGIEVGYKF